MFVGRTNGKRSELWLRLSSYAYWIEWMEYRNKWLINHLKLKRTTDKIMKMMIRTRRLCCLFSPTPLFNAKIGGTIPINSGLLDFERMRGKRNHRFNDEWNHTQLLYLHNKHIAKMNILKQLNKNDVLFCAILYFSVQYFALLECAVN